MATQNLNLNVLAGGLKEAVHASEMFRQNMEAGAKAMQGTSGSRKVADSTSSSYSAAAAKKENEAYQKQRGVIGGTGSSSSDFAAQSRGLGGLVHVYATFAANVFALSMAFKALSNAMDSTNLVRGLDQIGAASGRNLGYLAQQMVSVTDGAISLRQALTSTAMAAAGGMTNREILRMTEVAKKASLALGRDLPDSLDRITKGIIKVQPELLDELGIMARVIPAQQEYARSIGKSASALTDFEKRQAFTNAVLTEGEKKFSAIEMSANPYSRLLASMQDVMQTGLSMVNTVLGPLVEMLSKSPTALITVLAGIGSVLLKQAIPAIGMFRENARRMEEETTNRLKHLVFEQTEASGIAADAAGKRAQEMFKQSREAQALMDSIPKTFNKKLLGGEVHGALKKSPLDLTPQEVDAIANKHKELYDKIQAGTATKGDSDQFKKLESRAEKMSKVMVSYAEQSDDAWHKESEAYIARSNRWFTTESQKEKFLTRLKLSQAKATASANIADVASTMGPTEAIRLLRSETAKLDTGTIGKIGFAFKNTFSIATAAVGTFINAFGTWFALIGLVVAGIGLLSDALSNTAKQSKEYAGSLDALNSAADNIARTIENLNKANSDNFLSVTSSTSRATALNELSDALDSTVSKFNKLVAARSSFDSLMDGFWDMFGKGDADKLAAGLSDSVASSLKIMQEGPLKEKAKKAFAEIIDPTGEKGVDLLDPKSVKNALSDLTEIQKKTVAIKLDEKMKDASRETSNSATALKSLSDTLGLLSKEGQNYANSLIPTDQFSKLGVMLSTAGTQWAQAMNEPTDALRAISELMENTTALALLPPEVSSRLISYKQELEGTGKELGGLDKSIAGLVENHQNLVAKAKEYREGFSTADLLSGLGTVGNALAVKLKNAKLSAIAEEEVANDKALKAQQARYDELKKKADEIRKVFADIPVQLAKASIENLSKGLVVAQKEAGVIAAQGFVSVLKAAGADTAALEGKIAQEQISVQMQAIKATFNLAASMERVRVELKMSSAVNEGLKIQMELAAARTEFANKQAKGIPISNAEARNFEKLNDRAIANIVDKKVAAEMGKLLSKPTDVQLKTLKDASAPKADESILDTKTRVALVNEAGDYLTKLFGQEAQLVKLRAAMASEAFKTQIAKDIVSPNKLIREEIAIREKGLVDEKQRLEYAKQVSGVYDEQIASALYQNELATIAEAKGKALLDIEERTKIAKAVQAKAPKGSDVSEEAGTFLAKVEKEIEQAEKDATQRKTAADTKRVNEKAAGERQLAQLASDRLTKELTASNNLKLADLTSQQAKLAYLQKIGAVSESYAVSQSAVLEKEKLALEASSAQQVLKNELLKEEADLKLRIEQIQQTGVGSLTEANAALASAQSIGKDRLAQLEAEYASKRALVDLEASHNLLLAQQKESMDTLVSATQSLTAIFGELGTNIGSAAIAMETMAQNSALRAEAESKIQEEIAAQKKISKDDKKTDDQRTTAAKKASDLEVQLGKVKKKNAAAEVHDTATAISGVKKLFNEKSGAYKTLNALETAMHTYKLAMQAKEVVMDTIASAKMIANTVKEMIVGGGEAVINQGGGDPYSAIPRMIAMAAFVASIISSTGESSGGGASAPPAPSNADIQAAQLTGQSYNSSGQLVDNGLGVIGDPTAKLEGIKKSIDYLGKVFFDGWGDNTGSLLMALRGIQENTGSTVAALMESQDFIDAGGTSGKFSINTPYKANVSNGDFGTFVGGIMGGAVGSLVGGAVGGLADSIGLDLGGSIFGGSRSYGGVDSTGLRLNSGTTANSLINGTAGGQTYQNISIQHDSRDWLGRSTSWKEEYQTAQALPRAAMDALGKIFKNFSTSMIIIAKELTGSTASMEAALNSLPVSLDINTTGMNSQQVSEALGVAINKIMNSFIKDQIGWIEKYAVSGEDDLTSTAVRLIKDGAAITTGLKLIGQSVAVGLGNTVDDFKTKIDRQQKLIKLFGDSIDDFTSSIGEYYDAFYSSTDKLTMKRTFLQDSLDSLGISSVRTKDEFQAVVSGLDLSTDAGRAMFKSLMDLAPMFAEITDEINDLVASRDEYLEKFMTPSEKLASSQAKLSAGLIKIGQSGNLTEEGFRTLLKGADSTTTAGARLLSQLVELIPAFEEVTSASKELVSAWQSVTDKIMDQVKTIRGGMGNETQTYAAAQAEFATVSAAARAGDKASADRLTTLATSLLNMAEKNSVTALDLQRMKGYIAGSLETTAQTIAANNPGVVLPSFDVGTDYVPRDMIAQIHEGERIVPKAFNHTRDTDALAAAVAKLTAEVAELRRVSEVNEDNTRKTKELLIRVTRDGDSLVTTPA